MFFVHSLANIISLTSPLFEQGFAPYKFYDLTFGTEASNSLSSIKNAEEAQFVVSLIHRVINAYAKDVYRLRNRIGVITRIVYRVVTFDHV